MIKLLCAALSLYLASQPAAAQTSRWQREMDDARRAAANGENTAIAVRPGSSLAGGWPVGIHVFDNAPRPFCYAYVVPGEWVPVPGHAGLLRAKDGPAIANVTFVPPSKLAIGEGGTLLEQSRIAAVRGLELALHQPLTDVSLVPFESARAGTWQLKAAPVSHRDGRKFPFPLYILVDLSPDTVAEINVQNSGADEALARRIIAGLRTTSEPQCFWSDTERMLKSAYGER